VPSQAALTAATLLRTESISQRVVRGMAGQTQRLAQRHGELREAPLLADLDPASRAVLRAPFVDPGEWSGWGDVRHLQVSDKRWSRDLDGQLAQYQLGVDRALNERTYVGFASAYETADSHQLGAALDVLREAGLEPIVPVAGLAKRNEELFVKDTTEPIVLPRTSQALYLVQRVRDEAHRFAITYHRGLRAKRSVQSALDAVPGIGPKRKKALLRKFGSVKAVREADVEEIASTVGFTRSLAREIAPFQVNVNAVCPGAIRTRSAPARPRSTRPA
jgi:hypothetical protein